jgi:decaprenyl-phosphate phosphoribosyltransferase
VTRGGKARSRWPKPSSDTSADPRSGYRDRETRTGRNMSTIQTPAPLAKGSSQGSHHALPGLARMRALITLARPAQWIKNPAVILLALASLQHWTLRAATSLAWATALFILASVAAYTVNDIRDRERDRLHPDKRRRPIASGDLGLFTAWVFLLAVTAALIAGVAVVQFSRAWPVCAYLAVTLAYSFRLKHIPLVDAFAVAAGFVLRAEQGYLALGVRSSPWLLLGVFTTCLVFVLGKRQRELTQGAHAHRPALGGYSPELLGYLIVISATLSVVAYIFFVRAGFAQNSSALAVTAVFCAIFALFRYLQLIIVGHGGADPVRTLLGDRQLLVVVTIWLAVTISMHALHLATP